MSSSCFIKLEQFEGPMDLLLHLIRVNQLNIFDIDLLKLTTQYLDYLRLLKFRDLTDAAAFIDMASTLVMMKTRELLPNADEKNGEEGENEDDTLSSLQKRLQDYEMFRRAGDWLASEGNPYGERRFCNHEGERLFAMYIDSESPLIGKPAVLVVLYEQMLASLPERKSATVSAVTENITVETMGSQLKQQLIEASFVLLQNLYGNLKNRYEFIALILSFLQLVRDQELNIHQEEMMGPLWIYGLETPIHTIPGLEPSHSLPQEETAS
ncbi:MAG: ScpA family protein [Oligoflexales bacterium]